MKLNEAIETYLDKEEKMNQLKAELIRTKRMLKIEIAKRKWYEKRISKYRGDYEEPLGYWLETLAKGKNIGKGKR